MTPSSSYASSGPFAAAAVPDADSVLRTTPPLLRLRAPSPHRRPPPGLPSSPPLSALVISTTTSTALAPSTIYSPTTTSGPTSSPPSAGTAGSSPTWSAPATSEPPPPPPWPEGYIFSTDPDNIICRYCCKRQYNYKWYSHCYLCHTNENKS